MNDAELRRIAHKVCTSRQLYAFTLVYGPKQMSNRQAARHMGIDEAAVRGLLARAFRRIKHHVDNEQADGKVAA